MAGADADALGAEDLPDVVGGDGLGAIDAGDGAGGAGLRDDLRDRVDRPDDVRDVHHADGLDVPAREEGVELVELELTVLVDLDDLERGARVARDAPPRDEAR